MTPHAAMMRAQCTADSNFYLNAMWTLVTSCLEPLNSATDGPAEHLKISEWSSCCVIDSGRMLFVPRLRGDGCHLNHDRWYEIVVRASGVWPFVGSSSFWFVEEEDRLQLSQMKCYSGSVCSCKVYGSCRGIYGRPPRNSWELSFWSRSRTACIVNVVTTPKRAGQLGQDVALCVWCITVLILWGFRNQFYWMFCVWSSSIFDKAQMGVWNIWKLGTRTSSTLREWVMYPPPLVDWDIVQTFLYYGFGTKNWWRIVAS